MRTNYFSKISSIILSCYFLASCLSNGGFKTARPLKKGHHYFLAGIGKGGIKYLKETDISYNSQKTIENSGIPSLNVGLRYGASETIELGALATLPGTLDLDSKFNLYNSDKSSYSFYFGIGGFYLNTTNNNKHSEASLINNYYSLVGDYDISKYFTLQIGPVFSWRKLKTNIDDSKTSLQQYFGGISGGFYIKNFFFQIKASTSLSNNNYYLKQITLGYWGGWDDLNKNF
jgi:hypothetical protein